MSPPLDHLVAVAVCLLRRGHVVTVRDLRLVLEQGGVPKAEVDETAFTVWRRAMNEAGALPGLAKCHELDHAGRVAAQFIACSQRVGL